MGQSWACDRIVRGAQDQGEDAGCSTVVARGNDIVQRACA